MSKCYRFRRSGRCWYRLSVLERILLLVVVLLLLGCIALLLNLALGKDGLQWFVVNNLRKKRWIATQLSLPQF